MCKCGIVRVNPSVTRSRPHIHLCLVLVSLTAQVKDAMVLTGAVGAYAPKINGVFKPMAAGEAQNYHTAYEKVQDEDTVLWNSKDGQWVVSNLEAKVRNDARHEPGGMVGGFGAARGFGFGPSPMVYAVSEKSPSFDPAGAATTWMDGRGSKQEAMVVTPLSQVWTRGLPCPSPRAWCLD